MLGRVVLLLLVPGVLLAGVRYEPTPADVVNVMLELGAIGSDDLVADLGCGDGRIVIEAVRRHGARGLCVDIDPRRIAEASANARAAGVAERITFLEQDLFATDLRGVTVVMLFLSPEFNLKLRPKLERELAAGARVVSHWHHMGDWAPSRTLRIRSDGRERAVYLWILDGRR
jgi:SAM-dependent methyltransferase